MRNLLGGETGKWQVWCEIKTKLRRTLNYQQTGKYFGISTTMMMGPKLCSAPALYHYRCMGLILPCSLGGAWNDDGFHSVASRLIARQDCHYTNGATMSSSAADVCAMLCGCSCCCWQEYDKYFFWQLYATVKMTLLKMLISPSAFLGVQSSLTYLVRPFGQRQRADDEFRTRTVANAKSWRFLRE